MNRIEAVLRATAVLTPLALGFPAFAGGPTAPAPEPALAAAEPYVPPGTDWSGAYVGGQLGYADVDSNGGALDGNGILGGIHAGYRWDLGNFVAGAELDYDKSDVTLGATDSLDDVARLKLSGGTEIGNGLFYGTLGAAYANATVGAGELSDNGYFIGAGMTYGLGRNWTIGGELLQHRFSDFDGSGVDLDATTITARVGFRF